VPRGTAAILYADFGDDARTDDQDVLVQAREFSRVLTSLGYDAVDVRLDLDLGATAARLRALSPSFVVNLVESVGGSDALQYLGPAVLDYLGLPYTGSPTEAVFLAASKPLAKRTLESGGIATTPWCPLAAVPGHGAPGGPPWIVKPSGEHASYGIDDDSVVHDLASLLRRAAAADAGRLFVERYIEGRELNVSLLEGAAGVEVLPLAEIDFSAFPDGKPRIVGYRAKWDEASFEYRNSPRTFAFAGADDGLLDRVRQISRRAWDVFGLRGYARVDLRVDRYGTPWVLEVNTNPCLSPDAGFVAAAAQARISFDALLARVVAQKGVA
jgi:D-alanine-D-alanine ligase